MAALNDLMALAGPTMFASLLSRLKAQVGHAKRVVTLKALLGLAVGLVAAFLIAALFIAIVERYGAIIACLAFAAAFFVLALSLALALTLVQHSWNRQRPAQAQSPNSPLKDPMLLATLLQCARSVPARNIVPLVAIVAGAFMVAANARKPPHKTDDQA